MSTDRRHTRGRRALALVAGLTVVATMAGMAACGGDEDEPSTSPTTSSDETASTPSTTAPLSPEEEEAKAVYLELVEVIERLATVSPDPDDPDLARLAVDPVLSSVRDGTTTQRAENQMWRRGDRTSHSVGEAKRTDEGMSLVDCVIENDVLVDLDDESVVQSTPLTTRRLEVTLVETPRGWAVSDIATVERLEGEVPCDA